MTLPIFLSYLGPAIGIYAHIPMFNDIKNNVPGYSFASYFLWMILDFIAAYSIFDQGGNYLLSLAWGMCSGIIAILLIIKKKTSWSWFETLICMLVIMTLTLWNIYGTRAALISTIISLTLAGLPQIREMYLKPSPKIAKVYSLFVVSALITILSLENYKLENIAYPLSAMILSLTTTLLARKNKNKPKTGIRLV